MNAYQINLFLIFESWYIQLSGNSTIYSQLKKVLAKKFDNRFIPKYIPNDLPWYEKDGLDTWYLQNKCNYFLRDTDEHFKEMKIGNFYLIKNNVSEEHKKQYQQIDNHEIMGYPPKLHKEICSSIFCNVKLDGMYVKKETIDEQKKRNKKTGIGHGRFIKKVRDSVYAEAW